MDDILLLNRYGYKPRLPLSLNSCSLCRWMVVSMFLGVASSIGFDSHHVLVSFVQVASSFADAVYPGHLSVPVQLSLLLRDVNYARDVAEPLAGR
jgi:hypothetical protein